MSTHMGAYSSSHSAGKVKPTRDLLLLSQSSKLYLTPCYCAHFFTQQPSLKIGTSISGWSLSNWQRKKEIIVEMRIYVPLSHLGAFFALCLDSVASPTANNSTSIASTAKLASRLIGPGGSDGNISHAEGLLSQYMSWLKVFGQVGEVEFYKIVTIENFVICCANPDKHPHAHLSRLLEQIQHLKKKDGRVDLAPGQKQTLSCAYDSAIRVSVPVSVKAQEEKTANLGRY